MRYYLVKLIQIITKIFVLKQYYKIEKIKPTKDAYNIVFFLPGKRIMYHKLASEIFNNNELLSKFNPIDALLIGFCIAEPNPAQLKEFYKKHT